MTNIGTFPFGQPVRIVQQQDRTPKHVFVLGVYASAVHARWLRADGHERIRALAVASEPYIFWRGEEAGTIINKIEIPRQLGKLVAAYQNLNGPSGKALDKLFLEPMGLKRTDAWLCDLVPHSCLNHSQWRAIRCEYLREVECHGLPEPTVPAVPSRLTDKVRRDTILGEIRESGASMLLLLGDKPIQWFLWHFDPRWCRLSDFGTDTESYGRLHSVNLRSTKIEVLPLAHPRQVGQLGQSSRRWYDLHRNWVSEYAPRLLK